MSTKDALIVAATRLLDEGGPEHVTLREVGRRAGVSHNAPYKHFPDKTALLQAVALAELRRTATLFARAGENADPAAALRTAGLAWISWSIRHGERFRLVYGPWPQEAADVGTQSDDTWAAFARLVERAQEGGAIAAGETDAVTDGVRAVMQGAVSLALGGHLGHQLGGGEDPRAAAEQLFARQLDLLAARSHGGLPAGGQDGSDAHPGDSGEAAAAAERRSLFGRRR